MVNKMIEFKKKIDIYIADAFFKRLSGFMFKKNITYGLFFKKCNTLHTFFMKFNIDVIAIDKENNIIKIFYNIAPFKIVKGPKGTVSMYEFPTGYIK